MRLVEVNMVDWLYVATSESLVQDVPVHHLGDGTRRASHYLNDGCRQDADELTLKLLTSKFPFKSVDAFCTPCSNVEYC